MNIMGTLQWAVNSSIDVDSLVSINCAVLFVLRNCLILLIVDVHWVIIRLVCQSNLSGKFSLYHSQKPTGFGKAPAKFFYDQKCSWTRRENSKYLHLRIQIAYVAVMGELWKDLVLFCYGYISNQTLLGWLKDFAQQIIMNVFELLSCKINSDMHFS